MVYLVQSDTTVGFAALDPKRLNRLKNRSEDKPVIKLVDSLARLRDLTRVPKDHKKLVRRAKQTTFIFSSIRSFRVVKDPFVSSFGAIYSTSANKTGKKFDEVWAKEVSNVWVVSPNGFKEMDPSTIIKLGKEKIKKVR